MEVGLVKQLVTNRRRTRRSIEVQHKPRPREWRQEWWADSGGVLEHQIVRLTAFSFWNYVKGRLEPCNERGVRPRQRINLFHDRNARRKREASEECHQQTTIRVSDTGGDCLDGRRADRQLVADIREGRERRECARRDIKLPNQVLATVSNVNLVANDDQVKRVYVAKTGERGWVDRKIREISNQLHGDLVTLDVRECQLLARGERLLSGKWEREALQSFLLDAGAEMDGKNRAEDG